MTRQIIQEVHTLPFSGREAIRNVRNILGEVLVTDFQTARDLSRTLRTNDRECNFVPADVPAFIILVDDSGE